MVIDVKKVPLYLDDDQHEKLLKKKGKLTWVEFVMKLANSDNNAHSR